MRLDAYRRLAMKAFLKISRDMVTFKHAFLAWHPENNPPTHSQLVDQETARRLKKEYFDAYTALRSNCLSVGLLFDKQGDTLGKAIQDLYDKASQVIHRAERPPSAAECEAKMNEQISKRCSLCGNLLRTGEKPGEKTCHTDSNSKLRGFWFVFLNSPEDRGILLHSP
jgi:hypothetical protein